MDTTTTKNTVLKSTEVKKSFEKGIIDIPKIKLNRYFYVSSNVDKNIVVLDGSNNPHEKKSLLILASHSGTGKYAFFNYLYKLEINDKAYVVCDNVKYSYILKYKYLIRKNGHASIYKYKDSRTLVLITCTNNVKGMQTVYVFKELAN